MGFVFRDRRSGPPIWAICWRDETGRKCKQRTKAATRALARRILAAREHEVEEAKLRLHYAQQLPNAPGPDTMITLKDYLKKYMEHVAIHCSAQTVKRYRNFMKNHILPELGRLRLTEITPAKLQDYCDDRLKSVSASSARQELMFLSGLFRSAMKSALVAANPVMLVDKPSVENTIVRYLHPDEDERLLAAAPEPLRTAVIVAMHSGMRDGEQRNLKWEDVHFDENAIVVRNTKSRRDRRIPMSATLRSALQGMKRVKGSPYVFSNPDTRTKYDRFNNHPWRNLLARCGITKFRWHDLRHTFGSRLAQAGVPIAVIKELLGHGNIQVTTRYAHVAPSNLDEAVRALDGQIRRDVVDPTASLQPPPDAPLLSLADAAAYLRLSEKELAALLDSTTPSRLGAKLKELLVELDSNRRYVRREPFMAWLRQPPRSDQ